MEGCRCGLIRRHACRLRSPSESVIVARLGSQRPNDGRETARQHPHHDPAPSLRRHLCNTHIVSYTFTLVCVKESSTHSCADRPVVRT